MDPQKKIRIPDIELIPKEIRKEYKPKKQLFILGASIFFFLLVFLGGFINVRLYQKSKEKELKDVQNKLKTTVQEIDNLKTEKDKALVLQKELGEIKNLLERHIYWTKLFSILERLTIDTVNYNSIAGSNDGRVKLSAQGEGYLSVARQLLAFQETKEVKEVEIKGASKDEEGKISFKIELIFEEGVFLED